MTTVLLTTVADDLAAIVPADHAQTIARQLADEPGQVVHIRHVVTDRVIARVKPTTKPR
jgi:hypothetical protein